MNERGSLRPWAKKIKLWAPLPLWFSCNRIRIKMWCVTLQNLWCVQQDTNSWTGGLSEKLLAVLTRNHGLETRLNSVRLKQYHHTFPFTQVNHSEAQSLVVCYFVSDVYRGEIVFTVCIVIREHSFITLKLSKKYEIYMLTCCAHWTLIWKLHL